MSPRQLVTPSRRQRCRLQAAPRDHRGMLWTQVSSLPLALGCRMQGASPPRRSESFLWLPSVEHWAS
eukprot:4142565-Amphidinium_carterae.1